MERPLEGLVVVEASRAVAVRYCGRLFAQMGATVRRATGGDDRAIGYAAEAGEAFGRWLDQGKRIGAPAGPVDLVIGGLAAEDLAAAADFAGSLAGASTRLELTWFHTDGPCAGWRGTDEVIQAMSGLAWSCGTPAGPPVLSQGHGPQIALGLVGFNAALAGLAAHPRPRRIQANALEAYICLTETGAVSALMEGGASVRLGVNRLVPTFPCGSYRTADGWLGVTALTPGQWRAFCAMLGLEQAAADPRFNTTVERLLAADEVDALIGPRLSTRTTAEWVAAGQAARVPLTPMPDLRELPRNEHWRARGAFAAFGADGAVGPTLPHIAEHSGSGAPWPNGPPDAPLKGLRVVDFSMGWAGPLCARWFGDLGAEVIKVESDAHRDWWRGWETDQSGDPPPWETKFSFICANRNKRGILLDLDKPEGLATARALIAQADVLVENFAAGVMEKLGLGREARRALNPRLIAVSMPAFGAQGPLAGIRAYGSTVEQASGLPFINGEADWPPSMQHVAFGDPIAGLFAAAAALAALHGRERLGGAEIDLAQTACLFQFAADGLIAQQFTDEPLPRTGSRRPRAAPVCVAACAGPDDWLCVAVEDDRMWRALAETIGRPEWGADPGLESVVARDAHAVEIEAAIATWSRSLSSEAAAERLQAAGVAAAPLLRVDALGYHPQLAETGFWAQMDRAYVGPHITPAAPFAFDGARPALRRTAPTLGEHTAEVLAELGRTRTAAEV
jgi:crotonobetainyl-CoA:carnitine CoA-transferase CaiB-like acyl-CoA transferase